MLCDVRDFGAVGDGKSKDTVAIQKAVDVCFSSGGGTVLVPAGKYLTGTIWLKSNIDLHLESGSVIVGSTDLSDYNSDDAFPQNRGCAWEKWSGAHLILAVEAENVSISGKGTIFGNGNYHLNDELVGPPHYRHRTIKSEMRPGQMVYFCECSGVSISGVRLRQSPIWNLYIHGCDNVRITGLDIESEWYSTTGDGIDIDCSKNVIVNGCLITTCDNCITLRASGLDRLKNPQPCENITISDCVLKSKTTAIFVGVGQGIIRNAIFNNIVIYESGGGVGFMNQYTKTGIGTEIDNIAMNNIIIQANTPIEITTGYSSPKPLGNLYFSNMRVTASGVSYIGGTPENPVRNVRFHNLNYELKTDDYCKPEFRKLRDVWADEKVFCFGHSPTALGIPYVFYIENSKNIVFDRCDIKTPESHEKLLGVFGGENAEVIT